MDKSSENIKNDAKKKKLPMAQVSEQTAWKSLDFLWHEIMITFQGFIECIEFFKNKKKRIN